MKIQKLKTTAAILALSFSSHAAAAQYVNDIFCSLKDDSTLPQVVAYQQEWMAAVREMGFDEEYQTAIVLPVYGEHSSVPPKKFIWRGYFKDGEQMGRLNDFYRTSPEWGAKLAEVMQCEGGSLWAIL